MSDISSPSNNDSSLVKRDKSLVRRGLDLVGEITFGRVTVISEEYVASLLRRINQASGENEDIPSAFTDGTTENPHEVPSFDVNVMARAFDLVSLRDGYVLDYVYDYDGHAGRPRLYARPHDEAPVVSVHEYHARFNPQELGDDDEYQARFDPQEPGDDEYQAKYQAGFDPQEPGDDRPYLARISFDTSPEGYFQFSLFCEKIASFYLFWHSNYGHRSYLLTPTGRDRFVRENDSEFESTPAETKLVLTLDPRPTVTRVANGAKVRLFTHEINTGYSYLHLNASPPNIIHYEKDEVIVKNHRTLLY